MTPVVKDSLSNVPDSLRERTRPICSSAANIASSFVLYQIHSVLRADETSAPDFAITIANQQRLPVLVYSALSGQYPYQRYTFSMQGAGVSRRPIPYSTAHRWRHALPATPLQVPCLFRTELQIGSCGDWCSGHRMEGAFLSGAAAVGRVSELLTKESNASATSAQRQAELYST